jgi:hypothetical protein
VASSAETGGAARSGALLTPLFVGWPQYFSIDWTALESGGRPVVAGHVLNDWGLPARRLQLLVDALDDRGEVIAQRLVWVTSMELMPGTRAYFEVPAPVAASRYRVSVFAFDWSGGGRS